MERTDAAVFGAGAADTSLAAAEMREIAEQALAGVSREERVLGIIPDRTRDDNTHLLFPIVSQILAARGLDRLDLLVAQGTHPPMNESQKRVKIGHGSGEIPLLGHIYDHAWDREDALVGLGELSAEHVDELTGGLMREAVPVRVNALLRPGLYDTVLIFGATLPHEVAGYAGGAKYFFPGVSGPELTHMTHWLGALASIEHVIGRIETPTRRVIEAAAAYVPAPVISFTSVNVRDAESLHTRALYAGDMYKTFRLAAAVSSQVHVKYTGRRYTRVVALLDSHYDELWVGGKASYKLGGIIEEGGELIIYAPRMHHISRTHGRLIEKYGYAPLEAVREMLVGSDELRANLCVAAHLAHVSYARSRDADDHAVPRYRITLASGIPEDVCRRVRLGYLDYRTFALADYTGDPDTLIVENAGRDLYLLHPHETGEHDISQGAGSHA